MNISLEGLRRQLEERQARLERVRVDGARAAVNAQDGTITQEGRTWKLSQPAVEQLAGKAPGGGEWEFPMSRGPMLDPMVSHDADLEKGVQVLTDRLERLRSHRPSRKRAEAERRYQEMIASLRGGLDRADEHEANPWARTGLPGTPQAQAGRSSLAEPLRRARTRRRQPGETARRLLNSLQGTPLTAVDDAEMLVDGEVVLGFQKADQAVVSHVEVIDVLIRNLPRDVFIVHKVSIEDGVLNLQMLTTRLKAEPVVGDITNGGLSLCHSELGTEEAGLASFLYRLKCENGMKLPLRIEGFGSRWAAERCPMVRQTGRGGPEEAIGEKSQAPSRDEVLVGLEQAVQRLATALKAHLQAFERLVECEIPSVEEAVRESIRLVDLSQDVELMVLDALSFEPELGSTAYAFVNAFTRVATHEPSLSREERDRLMRVAARCLFGMFSFSSTTARAVLQSTRELEGALR